MNNHRVIAVCGKGGVGKTAFTTLLTKVMIEDPQAGKLLVVDADPALGLHYALGRKEIKTIGTFAMKSSESPKKAIARRRKSWPTRLTI